MRDVERQNISCLERLFYEGCKKAPSRCLGVEVEHFLVDLKTRAALPYDGANGVAAILEKLRITYPGATGIYEGKYLLGITAGEFTLTLEPAAQLEISIAPQESIGQIERIYRQFLEKLSAILEKQGAACVAAGYQPYSRADDVSLIPKERYAAMDAYFLQFGHGGREMMRATASTQVSVDYLSERDFCRKYHTAYVLTPIFKYLTDNTPVYEGKRNKKRLRRSEIWSRVDKDRSGIVPGALTPELSFHTYADYLYHTPLIYCPAQYLPDDENQPAFAAAQAGEGKERLTQVGARTPAQIWEKELLSEDAARHIMSMVFPDVRLKNYIEIRGADALAQEGVLAYTALVKGLLYHDGILGQVEAAVQKGLLTQKEAEAAEDALCERGEDAVVYGVPFREMKQGLLRAAVQSLPAQETHYLAYFTQQEKERGL